MSRLPQVGDKLIIRYAQRDFGAQIVNIQGATMFLILQDGNQTSLTWTGSMWILPNNASPDHISFTLSSSQNPQESPETWLSRMKVPPVPDPPTELLVNRVSFTPPTLTSEESPFPYKRTFQTPEQILQRFNNLKTYEWTLSRENYTIKRMPNIDKSLLQFEGVSLVISTFPENYDKYDNISDYFQEESRLSCKRRDQTQTPLEFWKTHQEEITQHALRVYGKTDNYSLRESCFQMHYECTSFRPSLMVGFIKMFKPQTVLDFSAGWGDRLIGAAAMGVRYVGVDPNLSLQPGYAAMREFFHLPEDHYRVLPYEFEKMDLSLLPFEKVDMVLTSPPFFDLEEYSDKNQSYLNRNFNQWVQDFLYVSVRKALSVLKSGGHLILYINDIQGSPPYVEALVRMVSSWDTVYSGCLPQKEGDKPLNPFWVWRKN